MNGNVTDLTTGKPAQVEEKPAHHAIAELLTHSSEQIMQARALSSRLPVAPNPGAVMGQILAANMAATESLLQAASIAYNMVAVAAGQQVTLTKVGHGERPPG